MTTPLRSVRLLANYAETLDKLPFEPGEVFYDASQKALRVYDGMETGGYPVLRSDLINIKQTALDISLNLGSGTLTAQHINGSLTGNVTGNLTGNVTGKASTAGNADTVTNGVYTTDIGTITGSMIADGTITNANLADAVITLGTTDLSFTTATTVVAGLTSISSTTFVGALTGNASTATKLATARTINSVSFDGSANITVTADASTLTNTTLSTSVVSSSLTTVGTLTSLEVAGDITADSNVVVPALPTTTTHATNKKYVDTRSIAMSIAMS